MMASYRPVFAWFPTKMTNGQWIWFRKYQSINNGKIKRLYRK